MGSGVEMPPSVASGASLKSGCCLLLPKPGPNLTKLPGKVRLKQQGKRNIA